MRPWKAAANFLTEAMQETSRYANSTAPPLTLPFSPFRISSVRTRYKCRQFLHTLSYPVYAFCYIFYINGSIFSDFLHLLIFFIDVPLATFPLTMLLQAMTTVAPRVTSSRAVSSPIPWMTKQRIYTIHIKLHFGLYLIYVHKYIRFLDYNKLFRVYTNM